jgi:hypothetical protein
MKTSPNLVLATLVATLAPLSHAQDDKAGYSGELSSLDGGLGGTVTVVDAETLRINDYQLEDASAPALYWWGSEDDDLSNGFRVSSEQVTDAAETDTLTIELDNGYTTENFTTFGLWCERFSTSFGETTLREESEESGEAMGNEEGEEDAGARHGTLSVASALAIGVAILVNGMVQG